MTTTDTAWMTTPVKLELTREDYGTIRGLVARAIDIAKQDPNRKRYAHVLNTLRQKLQKAHQFDIPRKDFIYILDLVADEWLAIKRAPEKQQQAAVLGQLHKKLVETRGL